MLRNARAYAWCAADPGSILLDDAWVPVLRSSGEEALRRVRDTIERAA